MVAHHRGNHHAQLINTIDLPEELRCGLQIAAGDAGKTPSEIVMEALDQFGIERLSEDQFQKRLTESQ